MVILQSCHCHFSNNTENLSLLDIKNAEYKTADWQLEKNRQQVEGQENKVLMELIVAVGRGVMLRGPRGTDGGWPPLSHPAHPLSGCNYLSHCERSCTCVIQSKGCGGRRHLYLTLHANQPCVSLNWHVKAPAATHTSLKPSLFWPSPFLAPVNYLWAYGGVGTIVCCMRSTQGDVGLMRTQWPLWLGLTAASFAWGDGAFISSSSKTSGEEQTLTRKNYTNTQWAYLFNLLQEIRLLYYLSFGGSYYTVTELYQPNYPQNTCIHD